MFNLGKTVYFADIEHAKIKSGSCIGYRINEQGHAVVTIKSPEGVFYEHHAAYCSHDESEIKNKLPSLVGLNDRIMEIQSQANREIDELLETMRGKPQFEHLTIKAEKKKA